MSSHQRRHDTHSPTVLLGCQRVVYVSGLWKLSEHYFSKDVHMQYNGIPFIQSSVCPGNEAYYVLGKTADAKVY